jgi:hypothetical protein
MHYALCTVHHPPSTIHHPLCTTHYTLPTTHYALCAMHCALCTIHCALCTMHYTHLFILSQLVPQGAEAELPEPTRVQLQAEREGLTTRPWRTEQVRLCVYMGYAPYIYILLICHGALHAVTHSRTQVPPVQPSYSLSHTYILLSSTSTTTLILSLPYIHTVYSVPPVLPPSFSLPCIHTVYSVPPALHPSYSLSHTYCLLSSTSTTTLILSLSHTYILSTQFHQHYNPHALSHTYILSTQFHQYYNQGGPSPMHPQQCPQTPNAFRPCEGWAPGSR